MSPKHLAWPAAVLAVAAVGLLSLAVGTRAVPLSAVLDALLHGGGSPDALVARSLRLPRTEIGLTAGAALGIAGAALQAVTRSPLADPGILGLSQGAAAGVVLTIGLGAANGFGGYVRYAFAGSVVAAGLVYGIAARGRGGASPVKLALAGTALSAMTAGATTVVLTSSSATLDQFRFWQVGALSGRDADTVVRMLPFLAAGVLLVLACARGLDALALGDDTARALGHRVRWVRGTAALGATLLTAAAVAAAGPIAFVGLAVPHLARRLVSGSGGHRAVLPLSALLGAVLLVGADVAGRVVRAPAEVPAGVMTALVGVPVLVALVRRRGSRRDRRKDGERGPRRDRYGHGRYAHDRDDEHGRRAPRRPLYAHPRTASQLHPREYPRECAGRPRRPASRPDRLPPPAQAVRRCRRRPPRAARRRDARLGLPWTDVCLPGRGLAHDTDRVRAVRAGRRGVAGAADRAGRAGRSGTRTGRGTRADRHP